MNDDTTSTLTIVLVAAAVLLVGVTVTDTVADSLGANDLERKDVATKLEGTQWIAIDNRIGENETVRNSRGNAIRFSGAGDSYLASSSSIDLADRSAWTVSQPIWVNESVDQANATMTVLSVGDPDLMLIFDQGQWSAIWYGPSDSYRANISAPDPTTETHITVSRNASELSIWRNGTHGETVVITTESTVDENLTAAQHCACTLDETRVFGANLSQTDRQELRDSPVMPLADQPTHLRIMFDAGSGTDVSLYFLSGSATVSNATWVDGFAPTVMERAGLFSADDYEWQRRGPEIRPLDGGRLDGAPVAFVEYDSSGAIGTVTNIISQSYALAAIIPLILIAWLVLKPIQGRQRGGR